MEKQPAEKYLEMQIRTASKEQLLLLLFDGAIKFADQASARINEQRFDDSNTLLVKAQRIVLELITTLDKKAIPADIYKNLTGLYTFVYLRMVEANFRRDVKLLDEAIRIMRSMRGTWAEAIEKVRTQNAPQMPAMGNIPGEDGKQFLKAKVLV